MQATETSFNVLEKKFVFSEEEVFTALIRVYKDDMKYNRKTVQREQIRFNILDSGELEVVVQALIGF